MQWRWRLAAAAPIPDLMLGVWDLREEQEEEEEGEGGEEKELEEQLQPLFFRFCFFGGVVVGFLSSEF